MSDDMFFVRNDVSVSGLRRVHALRAGREVDQAALLAKLGVGEDELLGRMVYEDEDTGMWHLRIYWKDDAAAELPGPKTEDQGRTTDDERVEG